MVGVSGREGVRIAGEEAEMNLTTKLVLQMEDKQKRRGIGIERRKKGEIGEKMKEEEEKKKRGFVMMKDHQNEMKDHQNEKCVVKCLRGLDLQAEIFVLMKKIAKLDVLLAEIYA